jgi:hypothetical protein
MRKLVVLATELAAAGSLDAGALFRRSGGFGSKPLFAYR